MGEKMVQFRLDGASSESRPAYMCMDADRYERLIAAPLRMLDKLRAEGVEIDWEEHEKEVDRKRRAWRKQNE